MTTIEENIENITTREKNIEKFNNLIKDFNTTCNKLTKENLDYYQIYHIIYNLIKIIKETEKLGLDIHMENEEDN